MQAAQKNIYVNDAYMPYLEATQYIQIFFGGSSSGKSYFISDRTVIDNINGYNYLVCRNVGNTIKKSVFNQIVKSINNMCLAMFYRINKSDMTITCTRNGKQILFAGLDDVEKLKSITPENGVLERVWIEEATEIKREAFLQLKKRLRGRTDKHKGIILTFNPVLKSHWIYQEFFADCWDESKNTYSDDRKLIVKTTYKDNNYLTPDDVYEFFNNEDAINDIEEKSAKIYDTEMNAQIDSTPNFFVDDAVASVKVRRLQGFFRKTIIASYDSKCCITGISIPTFLVASHIIPWADDRENRLNPHNGLCLNIMHDKAFDKGFMTLDSDFRIVFSKELPRKAEYEFLLKYEGKKISMPQKFSPSQKFLDFHRNNIFRG